MLQTIIRYLLQGISQKEIASIVGCSEGYISQVKERADFDLLCDEQKKFIQQSEKQQQLDKSYETLEEAALANLKENMAYAEFREVTRLIEILHRRKTPSIGIQVNNQTINQDNRTQNVILQLPQAAIPEIRLNNQNEVIGIGDDSLAPMNATNVKQLFAQLSMRKEQRERARTLEHNELMKVSSKEELKKVTSDDL